MNEIELISFITPTIGISVGVMLALMFFREWRKSRDRDFAFRKEELHLRQVEIETGKNSINIENANGSDTDLGGYITVDMPEERKSLFHDLLKGFEDYAALKGYKVNVSIDSSLNGKISFKIVVNDFGIVGNRDSVKKDLNEFITKIQKGEPLDDLESVSGDLVHSGLLMALKNRISMLQGQYEVQSNINDYYKSFFAQLPTQSVSHTQPIHIYNGGHEMDQRKYIANNSANVMQGDNHSNLVEGNNINIGSTFAEKNERVQGLEELIALLKQGDIQEKDKALRHLENAKEELTDEAEPDEGTIGKWLNKATGILKYADKGSELFTKAKEVMTGFGIEV
ncbi:hypothetical protein [Pseudoalteromonas tunicata]|jgi:hypothetical protein|uniref:Uncharacterized protein n=1 Tax=Pseudoalteromonas tunicata D2 TaxID=87626 RepID=A4C430_9GAMM|nr:hypothetical protein [Pseudoalteromonas tunicata]ATC97206.1 hypothetical protein PTUN_b0883 [Pseudoalteromonas tunicata]AXT33301.1 hypothetical protein D1819_21095 [Pseudoalteromonas tunicata]EAR30312.1 hypothetical protein PTD2_02046 [Pseudoalteromonas tunicata D2]